MGLMKGYTKKPSSAISKEVVKGFGDNPFLQKRHKNARKKSSKLRFSAGMGKINNSDNSGVTSQDEEI